MLLNLDSMNHFAALVEHTAGTLRGREFDRGHFKLIELRSPRALPGRDQGCNNHGEGIP